MIPYCAGIISFLLIVYLTADNSFARTKMIRMGKGKEKKKSKAKSQHQSVKRDRSIHLFQLLPRENERGMLRQRDSSGERG